ncbi:MAG: TonB-dependent receptor plug domain-containing protein [Chitinophagaceae bacterium]|nr:TonB-dependent receptor plug domain-containing protein [Chitinophagaceae bacterium]
MKSPLLTLLSATLITLSSAAQEQPDSTSKELNEVIIRAFEQNRKLMDVPAAVTVLTQKQLARFGNASLVPALNAAPGVRMEERSPGSYRLNIRGSSLRSPFGVRNVKVYVNDIPFTEPGGSTYLNQLGFYNIQSVEILKGPASSLYGTGTGGTVLLKTSGNDKPNGVGVDYSFGSFGLHNTNITARIGDGNTQQTISFSKLKSDGFRAWTKLKRDVFSWETKMSLNQKQSLHTFLMYADLSYQTPGGLTAAEFAANPKQARPAAGPNPGSAQANASVNQKTFFAGISHLFDITKNLINTTTLYGAFSRFANPTIRNFERRSEPHTGGRSVFSYSPAIDLGELKLIAGAELQRGWYNIRVYRNRFGVSDSLQTEDEVNPFTLSAFVQADWKLPHNWIITAGVSSNYNTIEIIRLNKFPISPQKRTYDNELAPRISILKKIGNDFSMYASVAKGFSPPTSAEVLPSTGVITTDLNAEEGWNYEAGIRYNWKEKLFVDLNGFYFNLNNTIVQRRDQGGADFFTNAGSTRQLGFESYAKYKLTDNPKQFLSQSAVWISYTRNDFTYKEFKQLTNDFSGKQLPSVPKTIVAAGIDLLLQPGVYLNITYTYTDKTPLNDANTFYGGDFHLLAMRLGYRQLFFGKLQAEFFVGGDNLFNETYSLGNDINAAANRFYNVAPGRNYYAGVSLFQTCKKK